MQKRKNRAGQKENRIIKAIFIWTFSALAGWGISSSIFEIVGLRYPDPQYLSIPMTTVFIILLTYKVEEFLGRFEKFNSKKDHPKNSSTTIFQRIKWQ